jgi:DNA-binding NarL/FixJ family response regulator
VVLIHIAVSDSVPAFGRGISAMLGEAGYQPEVPDDLLSWARQEQRWVVVMALRSAADWSLLEELPKARPDLVVVAVLEDTAVPTVVRALAAGAAAVIPRDASPETLRHALEAAIGGRSLLPTEVVQALTAPVTSAQDQPAAPSNREVEWLRALASGTTVSQLANRTGYSERAMFRLLRQLYARIGVTNRTEALIRAHDLGWLR